MNSSNTRLLKELDSQKDPQYKKSKASYLSKLATQMAKSGDDIAEMASSLIRDNRKDRLELGMLLIAWVPEKSFYSQVLLLCDDSDWEIREYAGEALSYILKKHFSFYKEKLKKLRKNESVNIRRGVVLALKYLAKYRIEEYLDGIFEVLAIYLDDGEEYVRKNLGPFAIGDAMIVYYPDQTMDFILAHKNNSDKWVQWNLASVFTAAGGAKHHKKALPMLFNYLNSTEQFVRNVSMKALRRIYEKYPDTQDRIRKQVVVNMKTFRYPVSVTKFIQ